MSLFYASLNSGSNGNCYYVGNAHEGILVDAGIPLREIEKRSRLLGIDLHAVKALFITHEHSDHIRGAYKLAKKYALPVYASAGTFHRSYFKLDELQHFLLEHENSISIGDLEILPFSKKHDAADPLSIVVNYQNLKAGIITDVGALCENLTKHFQTCHIAILESNYDEKMLLEGKYPYYLKQRIRSGVGHLSNTEALQLVEDYRNPDLKHVVLGHISKENNRPEIVEAVFSGLTKKIRIDLASRYEATALFEINSKLEVQTKLISSASIQMQLFANS